MKRNGGKFAWQQNNCSKKYIFQDNVLNYYNEPEGEDKTHIQSEFMQPHGAVKDQHIEEEGKENIFDLDLELTGYSTNPMEHSLLEDTHLLLDDTHLLLEMNDDFQETVLPDLFQEGRPIFRNLLLISLNRFLFAS